MKTCRYTVEQLRFCSQWVSRLQDYNLDECDYYTPNAQAALRNLMETFQ